MASGLLSRNPSTCGDVLVFSLARLANAIKLDQTLKREIALKASLHRHEIDPMELTVTSEGQAQAARACVDESRWRRGGAHGCVASPRCNMRIIQALQRIVSSTAALTFVGEEDREEFASDERAHSDPD
jgi:hypothetical protein